MTPLFDAARDVANAEAMAVRQRGALDWDYIALNLAPLADIKEQPEIMATVRRLRSDRG